jgi:hypothetical protein
MMDGDLPTRWGGMIPAAERIDRLAEFILREDPDVFLGQEIMSAAGEKLYERLKDKYAYFWIGIGMIPVNVTLIDDTYDLNKPRECALSDHRAYKAVFRFI